jgi:hypothetical protein
LQERDRRRPWQAVLAAQMQKSTDEAMAAVSVIVTAARPVTVVGKMLEHQVQQLHRFCDFRVTHWFDRSRSATELSVSPAAVIGIAARSLQNIGLTKSGLLSFTLPTRGLTGQQTISSEG